MSKAEKRYKNSPELKRDGEGKMKVSKKEKEAARTDDGTQGMAIHEEGMPIQSRHMMERTNMHSRHEVEHSMHGNADKKELHGRHLKEMADLHKKHEKEIKG